MCHARHSVPISTEGTKEGMRKKQQLIQKKKLNIIGCREIVFNQSNHFVMRNYQQVIPKGVRRENMECVHRGTRLPKMCPEQKSVFIHQV